MKYRVMGVLELIMVLWGVVLVPFLFAYTWIEHGFTSAVEELKEYAGEAGNQVLVAYEHIVYNVHNG